MKNNIIRCLKICTEEYNRVDSFKNFITLPQAHFQMTREIRIHEPT